MQEVKRSTSRQQHQEYRNHADAEGHRTVDQRAFAFGGEHGAGVADGTVRAPIVHVQAEADNHGQDLVNNHRASFDAFAGPEHEVVISHSAHVDQRIHQQRHGEDGLADRVDRLQREQAIGEALSGTHRARRKVHRHQSGKDGDCGEGEIKEHGLKASHEEHSHSGEHLKNVDDYANDQSFAFKEFLGGHRWAFLIARHVCVGPQRVWSLT